MSKKIYSDKYILKRRMLVVLSILLLLFFVLTFVLTRIMLYKSSDFINLAKYQWVSKVKIDAKRGRILDRNGNELAVSGNVYRIDLDLKTIKEGVRNNKYTIDELGGNLAEALGMKKEDVLEALNKKGASGEEIGYSILKRRVEPENAEKVKNYIKKVNINGIIISPDTKRYYPNNDFASFVIGHTNSDGKGLTGIELYYDKYLSGTPGQILEERENLQQDLPYGFSQYTAPVDGKDVVLTLDERIQFFAEKYAKQALNDNKAKAVSIIVMNPNNGEVLAMANNPGYDPNNPWIDGMSFDELQKSWRNRAVSDAMEPGSIFKVITADAALEEGIFTSGDEYVTDCGGSFTVAGSTIHCWKRTGHGRETFVEILKNSCNVGFAKLGEKLGANTLYKYIKAFGFGEKTGVDLPGEAQGIIMPASKMSSVDVATISFGQANTASMIQYMAAFNTIANGGTWIRPHLLKEVLSKDDSGNKKVDSVFDNYGKRQVVSEEKTKQLRGFLEKVATEGGSKKAFIEGYQIAGKTGTAQVPRTDGKGYAQGKYLSSFAGMAPSDNPQISIMISILEPDPSNYYAGQIAAPVAKELFNDIFNYLAIEPTVSKDEVAKSMLKDVMVPELRGLSKSDAVKKLKELNLDMNIDANGEKIVDMSPKPGCEVKEGSKIVLYTGETPTYNKVVIMPDLNGLNKEKATEVLNNLGLKAKFTGEGMVGEQSVEAGQEVAIGTVIDCTLEIIDD